ncbi:MULTISPECIES: hypothetical protein [Saccharothrix]|uniref:DUF2613 family protein n=1 Tax=Saccharothrix variisporea TaxID=543527 RepID=A0A495XHV4_9PSEU|nr:hypothetical protein [Saccharothrix variisporea]NUT92581.1 hypothetical protein [Saccharothrix sp.]RKT72675.1 hypothetical protein DFJ66_5997 [Saccharothrix variisporea]
MGKIVAAVVVILAGIALATGGTVALVGVANPDRSIDLDHAPAANGAGGVVDYGTTKR